MLTKWGPWMHNKGTFLVQSLQVTHKKPSFRVHLIMGVHTKLPKRVLSTISPKESAYGIQRSTGALVAGVRIATCTGGDE